jgi:hypothetical protein
MAALLDHEDLYRLAEIFSDEKVFQRSCRLAIPENSGPKEESWGVFPIGDLHMQVYMGHYYRHDTPNMLKVWLRFFYLVEPNSQPRCPPVHRINFLRRLIVLLNVHPPHPFLPYPADNHKIMTNIWYHLGYKLLRDVEKCFGEDSEIAKFQRWVKLECFGTYEKFYVDNPELREQSMEASGCDFISISETEEGQRAKEKFVKDMNELLAWAGILPLTEEELL